MVHAGSQAPGAQVLASQLQAHFVLEKPLLPMGGAKV